MKDYKTLLVAVDLEGGATQVLNKAAEIAKHQDVKVIVLNVVFFPVPTYPGYYGEGLYSADQFYLNTDNLRKELLPDIESLAKSAGLNSDNVVVEFGRPVETIVDVAAREKADVIILGSHGRHGISLLLGSTANGVLHHAKCDVLAIRIHEEAEK